MMLPNDAAKFFWLCKVDGCACIMISSCNIVPLLLPAGQMAGMRLGEGRPSSRLEVDGVPWETVDAWFAEADWDGDGRIAGEEAKAFFTRSGLPVAACSKVRGLRSSCALLTLAAVHAPPPFSDQLIAAGVCPGNILL